jgi:hypothetical protein
LWRRPRPKLGCGAKERIKKKKTKPKIVNPLIADKGLRWGCGLSPLLLDSYTN